MQALIIGSIPLMISAIISIIYYKQLEPAWLRLFPWFLAITFFIQIGGYLYSHILEKSNHFIFNGYILIEYIFYLFFFYKSLESRLLRAILSYIIIGYIIFFIIEVFLLNSFFVYNPFAKNIGELLTFCCCLLYFFELLQLSKIINYFAIPMFWITTGIMLAVVGNAVYLSFFDYILKNNLDFEGKIYGIIMTTLSILEYGLFTIGFIVKNLWTKAK